MRRGHRLVHRRLWPILAVMVGIGFALALSLRPAPAGDISRTAIEAPQ
jgi:hypothetical protein